MSDAVTIHSALLELADEAFIVRDMEDCVRFWSRGAERLYGWKSHEALGQNLPTFLDEHLLSDDTEDPSAENGAWTGELRHRTKDGQVVLVRSRMKLLQDDGGSPTSVLITNTDITQQKALEAALVRMQRTETVNRLIGLIVHNLNNELALLSLQLIEQPEREIEQCFGTLRQSAECAGVMARLLSFVKSSDSECMAVPIDAVIEEVADVLRHAFPECIEIKKTIPATLWRVIGNPTHLRQAILNVCLNAREAIQSNGVLTIGAENIAGTANRIVIQVSDSGTGIPPEMKDDLFKPFLTTKDRAAGLGLFTTARIIKDHGGTIEIATKLGQGTQFRIYLPSAESAIGNSGNRVSYVKSA
jgi:two-component system cell cycle sensor histidine kinase/response regulator CckA